MDQDTDNLLLASLQQFGFNFGNKKIQSLFEIDGDILRLLCFQFLEFMGSQVTLTSMKGQQKFRQSTKISEELKNLCNLRIDINSLLAPSKDDLRKIVVAMLQKISMHEDGDNPRLNISQKGGQQATFDSYEEKIIYLHEQRRKEILKKWTKEDWIHPALGNNKFNQFRMYDNELNLDSGSLSNKLIVDIIYGKMKPNLYASIAKIIDRKSQVVQKEEFIQENFYADEFQKLTLKQHAAQVESIKSQITHEIVKTSKKKVNRLAEQFVEQVIQTEEEVKQQLEEEKQTIFNLEMQFQEEQAVTNINSYENQEKSQQQQQESEKSSINRNPANSSSSTTENNQSNASISSNSTNLSSSTQQNKSTSGAAAASLLKKGKLELGVDFDIEGLKSKHKVEIDSLVAKHESLLKKMENYQSKRQRMEDNAQQKIEEGEILKEQNKLTKKQIENMELLIKELETKGGSSELKKEIKEIEEDIEQIEIEWKEYQENEVKSLENLKDELGKRKEKIELIRDKSKRIDQEYQQLIADIRNNYDKKEKLVEDFKRMPTGGNRMEYVKKIMEIKKNYDKQRGDIQKIVQDVKSVEESISYYQGTLERHMAELEGIYNTDAKKNESLSKQIYKIYQEYRSVFEQTISNLREIGNKKIETRAVEAKTILIATKHYDKSMDKLKQDIEEIRQENLQLQKTVAH